MMSILEADARAAHAHGGGPYERGLVSAARRCPTDMCRWSVGGAKIGPDDRSWSSACSGPQLAMVAEWRDGATMSLHLLGVAPAHARSASRGSAQYLRCGAESKRAAGGCTAGAWWSVIGTNLTARLQPALTLRHRVRARRRRRRPEQRSASASSAASFSASVSTIVATGDPEPADI